MILIAMLPDLTNEERQLVSHALMKIFRRGTQKRPTARLGEIDVLLKGYVVSPPVTVTEPRLISRR